MSGNPQLDTQIITAIFSVMTGVMTAAVMAPVLKASGQAYGGGTDGSTGNRRAVCNVSLTQAGGLVATKDGADATSQATWTIYAR